MLANSKIRIIAIALAIILFSSPIAISALGGFSRSSAQTQTGTMGIVIPLYTYPGSTWSAVISAKNAHPNVPFIAVINPNSGPGSSQDSNYVQGIHNLQAAGITVLGYVDTAYAGDSVSSVEANVNLYNNWYHVNGIMFDDMSNLATDESYYSTLNNYVHSLGMPVTMGNPGATVPTSEVGVFNILDVYESTSLPVISSLLYSGYPTSDFSLVGIGVSLDTTFLSSAQSYVGYVFLTDATLPNPYDVLPSYFTSEVADLAALDPSTTTSTVTTSTTSASSGGTATITVNSVSLGGIVISGMWTTVSSGGNTLATGYTPLTFTGTIGTQYTVTVANYGNYIFSNWKDGTTNPSETLTLGQNTVLTAYYNTGSTTTSTTSTLSTTSSTSISSTTTHNTTTTTSSSASTTRTTSSTSQTTTSRTSTSTASDPSPVITIKSSSPNGTAFSGIWTEVQAGGSTVASGFTPLMFSGKAGTTYTITAYYYPPYSYGKVVFGQWSTGSTSMSITVTPTASTTYTAYFDTVGATTSSTTHITTTTSASTSTPSTATLTIQSLLLNGASLTGMWTVVQSNGVTIATGYTPFSLAVNPGQQYTVSMSDYGSYTFSKWNTGSTSSSITITPTQSTTLTAYYSSPVSITLHSANLKGSLFSGMWFTVQSGGATIASGYSTLTVSAISGNQYTITASNYGKYVFSHWSNGNTNPTITITPTQNIILTAYYNT